MYKEYWDNELSRNWQDMHELERLYRNHVKKQKGHSQIKWDTFKRKQHKFDRLLKKKKHAYNKGLLFNMEACNNKDPNEFWNYMRKLGPSKCNDIPWEVEIDGKIKTDRETVLNKWTADFKKLYQCQ